MPRKRPAPRGRGTGENPPNRFERLAYVPDPDDEVDPESPATKTEFYRDTSRSIIAYNQSPDVGFEASINPYRGCEHGCVYCLSDETPILMADSTMRRLADVQVGDWIYGTERQGWYRRYVKTRVLAHWRSSKPAFRISLADGTELLASGDHRFLTERGWKFVVDGPSGRRRPHLTAGNKLMGTGAFAAGVEEDSDYRGGHGLFHSTAPAIRRKAILDGLAVKSAADLRVSAVEPLGESLPMADITTGTGDFIANGVVSHNCYARPTHEYFGLSSGLDFESKIFVKEDAPALLRRELSAPGWKPQVIAVSGVTDAYQPIERRLKLTRGCLEVLAEFRNPAFVITKSHLVARDRDVLGELAKLGAGAVFLSVTTLCPEVHRAMEPRASTPESRLVAIRDLSEAGIPAGVMVAPVIPGLTDHEMPAILDAAWAAGARRAGYVLLRLPFAVKSLFEDWLERHFPDRKDKVLNRIRHTRGGKLNDPGFGSRMRGEGIFADQIEALFRLACARAGFEKKPPALSTAGFRRPGPTQLTLFDL